MTTPNDNNGSDTMAGAIAQLRAAFDAVLRAAGERCRHNWIDATLVGSAEMGLAWAALGGRVSLGTRCHNVTCVYTPEALLTDANSVRVTVRVSIQGDEMRRFVDALPVDTLRAALTQNVDADTRRFIESAPESGLRTLARAA